jgi:hypothetical protein
VTQDAIRTAVNGHSCVIGEVRYDFRLNWAAVERYVDPALARYLLCVEAVAAAPSTGGSASSLHLWAWVERTAELPSLLNDALRAQLHERLAAGAPRAAQLTV